MSGPGENIPVPNSNPWWGRALASEPLTQGDLIEDCQVMGWDPELLVSDASLEDCVFFGSTRAVVMTQACDLANNKAPSVTLCRVLTLIEYLNWWYEQGNAQAPVKPKTIVTHVEDIRKNNVERFAFLSDVHNIGRPGFVVDLYSLFSLPRIAVDKMRTDRHRICAPYREYLSQRLSRVYMRIALECDISHTSEDHVRLELAPHLNWIKTS